jgi:hypothetical protein
MNKPVVGLLEDQALGVLETENIYQEEKIFGIRILIIQRETN